MAILQMDHILTEIFIILVMISIIVGIEPTKTLNMCGKCMKNDSSCHMISGIFTRRDLPYGYREITEIPRGACSINITEIYSSRNYLAIKRKSGDYILNGHWNLKSSGSYEGGGTRFHYKNPLSKFFMNEKENIYASGPLNESVLIMIIKQDSRIGIKYEFTVPAIKKSSNQSVTFVSKNETKTHVNLQEQSQENTITKPNRTYSIHSKTLTNGKKYDYLEKKKDSIYVPTQNDQFLPAVNYNSPSKKNYRQNSYSPKNTFDTVPAAVSNSQRGYNSYLNSNPNYQPEHKFRHHRDINKRIIPRQSFNNGQQWQSTNPQYNSLRSSHATYIHKPGNQNPSQTNTLNSNSRSSYLNSDAPYQLPYWNERNRYKALAAPPVSNIPSRNFLQTNQIPQSQPLYPQDNKLYRNSNKINPNSFNFNRQAPRHPIQNQINPNSFSSNRQSLSSSQGKVYLETAGKNNDLDSEFSWKISGFTKCSEECGGGLQTTIIVCVRGVSQALVTDDNCNESQKPKSQTVSCNGIACPADWHSGEWSKCSTSCGAGTQTRNVSCKQRVSAIVQIDLSANECRDRKIPSVQTCNQDKPCVRWKIGEWGKCSVECGRGQRNRFVICVNIENKTVAENKCPGDKPDSAEVCDMGSCAKTWFYSTWSTECTKTCGDSYKTREVLCSSEATYCSNATRPDDKKRCEFTIPCGGKWFAGPWGDCSISCGQGIIEREVLCMKKLGPSITVVGDENCNLEDRPESAKGCSSPPCVPKYFTSDWSECSKSCGSGFRTREVKCLDSKLKPNTECALEIRPSVRSTCNKRKCNQLKKTNNNKGKGDNANNANCTDKFDNCDLVVQARLCDYDYYKDICCASCRV